MPFIPAVCRDCDAIFTPRGVLVEDSVGSVVGGVAGPCPFCGGMGDLLEGIFDARGTVLELVSGPAWTREALHSLQVAAERAAAVAEENPELAASFIQSAAPSLAQRAWQAAGSGQVSNFLAVVLFAVGYLLGQSGTDEITPEQVEEIITSVVEQVDGDDEPPTPSSPRPDSR